MEERRKIRLSPVTDTEPTKPTDTLRRKRSIMPIGLSKPEIVPANKPEKNLEEVQLAPVSSAQVPELSEQQRPYHMPSATPTGQTNPQTAPATNTEVKIVETPTPSSESHTGSRRKRPKFEDRFNRVTTYIRADLHEGIRRRYDNLEIGSITSLINAAVESYLRPASTER